MLSPVILDNRATAADLLKHYAPLKSPALRRVRITPNEAEFIEDTLGNWQKKPYADRLAVEIAIVFLRSKYERWPTFVERTLLSQISPERPPEVAPSLDSGSRSFSALPESVSRAIGLTELLVLRMLRDIQRTSVEELRQYFFQQLPSIQAESGRIEFIPFFGPNTDTWEEFIDDLVSFGKLHWCGDMIELTPKGRQQIEVLSRLREEGKLYA